MSYSERIALDAEGLSLSRLVLGAWRLLSGPERPDANRVADLINDAIDLGMTSFDHADIYGDYGVEEVFGAGLKQWRGQRERIELITKCDIMLKSGARPDNRIKHYDTSAGHIEASVNRSLKNLQTDYRCARLCRWCQINSAASTSLQSRLRGFCAIRHVQSPCLAV